MRMLTSKWLYLLCPSLGLGLTAATVFIVITNNPIPIGGNEPHGFPIPWLAAGTRTIYWFAFTIDTIIWSSLVLVPLHMLRRVALDSASARARLLGLCPKCSYDLRASPGPHCPECGHLLPIKSVQKLRH